MFAATWVLASACWIAAAETTQYPPETPKRFVDLFEEGEYRYTGGSYHDERFRYRLFVPRPMKPGQRYPLLLWLPGFGQNGSDNIKSLRWLELIVDDTTHPEKYPFFILVVQCPTDGAWSLPETPEGDMLSVSHGILQKVLQEQPVDLDRVCVSGPSLGGTACWQMAQRYPELFSAVGPMGSRGGDVAQAERLVHLPVWAFHNYVDPIAATEGAQEMVAAVQNAGGTAHLTVLPASGHAVWPTAFHTYDLMGWMLAQRRGASVLWTPPGCRPWKWWQVFGVPLAFTMLLGAAWYTERSRRRRLRRDRASLPLKTPPEG